MSELNGGQGYDDFDPHSADNLPDCTHPYVSWHGSRGECQDCGETVPSEYDWAYDLMFNIPGFDVPFYSESEPPF